VSKLRFTISMLVRTVAAPDVTHLKFARS